MRHAVVERLALSGLALSALFVIGFVSWVRPTTDAAARVAASPPAASKALFARHCQSCHERTELTGQLLRGQSSLSPERRLELEVFLEDHGEATAEEDRAILDELAD